MQRTHPFAWHCLVEQLGALVDQRVLCEAVEQAIPAVPNALRTLGGAGDEVAVAALRWFLGAFTIDLTPASACAVWDWLLAEGYKVGNSRWHPP